jgi:hypothetical protein
MIKYIAKLYPRPRITAQRAPQKDNIVVPEPGSTFVNRSFKANSRRVGMIGEKVGLINMYDQHGKWHLLTIIRVSC